MIGQYQHNIDAKGRLFIPAKLREELGDTFYVTISLTDRCLTIYSDQSWQKLTEKFDNLPYTDARKAARLIFANTTKCEPDGQGRILLPQKLRDYAGLKKDVVVAGVSAMVEIWDAEKWTAMENADMESDDLFSLAQALRI
ncbi:MAG: division/cell wall cluster transcriptional repressor MraZ [Oscillospiraceae bacterium]|nr:division/cell wall cluster transcriptional repressor MraZ [Oscillospiraceae bacterium]